MNNMRKLSACLASHIVDQVCLLNLAGPVLYLLWCQTSAEANWKLAVGGAYFVNYAGQCLLQRKDTLESLSYSPPSSYLCGPNRWNVSLILGYGYYSTFGAIMIQVFCPWTTDEAERMTAMKVASCYFISAFCLLLSDGDAPCQAGKAMRLLGQTYFELAIRMLTPGRQSRRLAHQLSHKIITYIWQQSNAYVVLKTLMVLLMEDCLEFVTFKHVHAGL